MKKTLLLVLVLALSLCLFGCGGDEPAAQAPAGDTQAAAPQAAPVEAIKWVGQSYGATGSGSWNQMERIVTRINAQTGGRLTIEMLPAGAICSIQDMLESTSAGTLDVWHGYQGNYTGMVPAAALYSGLPGYHIDETAARVWMQAYGGNELLDEIFQNKGYNVKSFAAGLFSSEIFMHSTKKVESVDDLKGMKIRAGAMWAEVASELGAVPISVAGSEVYTSLERGVVDAIEFGAPCVNIDQGFQDIAKYCIVPGIHQSWGCQTFGINLDKWNALPEDLQNIVKYAVEASWGYTWEMDIKADIEAWKSFKEWEEAGKIEIISLSQEDADRMNEITIKICEQRAQEDPDFKKVFEHQQAFMKEYSNYYDDYSLK